MGKNSKENPDQTSTEVQGSDSSIQLMPDPMKKNQVVADPNIQVPDPTKKPIAGYVHLTNDQTIGNITVIENKITKNWDIHSPGRTSIPITAEQALQLKKLIESFVNAG